MTQSWTDNVYEGSHDAQTDLQNMENNFLTLKTLFAGDTSPANTEQGMPWFDTSIDLLRIRNAANGSWYGVMHADASQQIWVYRNDAMSGWVVVTSVTDKVLAIKGGSQAYDVTGGTTAGTWQQPGHTLSLSEIPSHDHGGGGSTGSAGSHNHSVNCNNSENAYPDPSDNYPGNDSTDQWYNYKSDTMASDMIGSAGNHDHSYNIPSEGGDGSHDHGSTYRPAAAVGTLQRMDV